MPEIKSGRFSIKVDRATNNTQTGTNGKTSEVIVYKGLNLLTPVNATPSENQYRVTLSCTGCTAELKDDYKTIYVKNVTASSAKIDVTINVENKVNYKKTISIEKVISENEISNMKSNISVIEQKADSISLKVEQTEKNLSNNYPTYSKMYSAIDMKADKITSTVSKTYTTKDDFNNLNIGNRNMLLKTSDYKILSCDGSENQCIFLYNISDPSLLAGKTATLTFTYKLSNWSNGQGGFNPQTGDSNYVWFDKSWLWSEGKFEYSATTSFPSNFNDTKFYIRSDWIDGTIEVTEARLVISDKKADWSPAPEDVENRMSTLEQTAETLTAKFTDGYTMGIIEQSINGIKVKHSSIDSNSYTYMSATGFYLKNKGTDVFRVDANGLYVKGNGDFTGKVTASSGTIGGYTISDYKLSSGNVGMCSDVNRDYAFWAGGSDGSHSPFRVGHDGWLYASNASITGTITSSNGTIGGYTISDYKLTSGRVGMCSNESKDYAFWAGGSDGSHSPFRVGHDGWLYASNASITGTITSSTIEGGTINIGDGTFVVNSSGQIKARTEANSSGQYLDISSSTYKIWKGSKCCMQMGFRDLTFENGNTVTGTPAIYIGADGIDPYGGNAYDGNTGRYYARWYTTDQNNSQTTMHANMPTMMFEFNTKYKNANTGRPIASQIKMYADGDMRIAPAGELEIYSHKKKNAINADGDEELLARFTSSTSDYYPTRIEACALCNIKNSKGLRLADYYKSSAGAGYDGTDFMAMAEVRATYTSTGDKYRTLRPHLDDVMTLGSGSYRWSKIYASVSTISTSDRRCKTNIEYLTAENKNVSTNCMTTKEEIWEFVKDIDYASYNFINGEGEADKDNQFGFILQDLLQSHPDLTTDLILDSSARNPVEDENTNEVPLMGYNTGNYVNILGCALQQALQRIEVLENKLNDK